MELLLREATLNDAPLLAELTRRAWLGRVTPSSGGHRETAVSVTEHLRRGGAFILLDGETPIGSVRWLPVEGESDVWEILRMGVLPQWSGRQLSQHLLEAVIHHALACNVDELRLAVRSDQPRLLDVYAALGFEPAPELEAESADRLDAMPTVMRRMLRN